MPPIESGAAYRARAISSVCLVQYRVPFLCLVPTLVEYILGNYSQETCLFRGNIAYGDHADRNPVLRGNRGRIVYGRMIVQILTVTVTLAFGLTTFAPEGTLPPPGTSAQNATATFPPVPIPVQVPVPPETTAPGNMG